MSSDCKQLPQDAILEIASRIPTLKTLDSCKAVSKEWNEIISEARFMPTYCGRTKNVSGYFLQGMETNQYFHEFVSLNDQGVTSPSSIRRLPRNTMIVASCVQGILCCLIREDHVEKYCVCKPATDQWETIPRPTGGDHVLIDTSMSIMVLGSSTPNKLHYKIARIKGVNDIGMAGHFSYMCEIFDSKAWEWTDLGSISLPYPEVISTSAPSVTAANSMYWITSKDNVIEYRESSESFCKFPLPKRVRENSLSYRNKKLVEYQGGLGFVCLRGDNHFEVWLKQAEGPKMIIWSRKMEVDVSSIDMHASLVGFYNSGIAFFNTGWEAMFYKTEDSRLSRVKLDRVRWPRQVFPFRSDFELVDIGRPVC